MTKSFVKLSLLIPIEEIGSFLSDYPDAMPSEFLAMQELQVNVSHAELRDQSINHLLNHIPRRYAVIDCDRESPKKPKLPYRKLEEALHIEALVQDGVFQILPEIAIAESVY
jgi:hypothetical protein